MRGRTSAAWLMLAAAGCMLLLAAGTSLAKETKLKSEVIAAEHINPNRRGEPQPVRVQIFYLAEDDKFLQASFAALTNPESTVLGDELVRRVEHLIGPGETLELDETFDEAARFIGVVAEFADLDQALWRSIAEVPVKRWTQVLRLFRNNKLQILVDGTTVSCAIVAD